MPDDRMDRTLCPVCMQGVDIYPDGTIEIHYDTNTYGELEWCPMSHKEAPSWTERNTREAVSNRSGGICEYCQAKAATDKAHRIGVGVGGQWTPANIVDLCRGCHHRCHMNPNWARTMGLMLRAHEEPLLETVAVVRHNGMAFQPTAMVVMQKGRRA